MKVGIIGVGHMGGDLARQATAAKGVALLSHGFGDHPLHTKGGKTR